MTTLRRLLAVFTISASGLAAHLTSAAQQFEPIPEVGSTILRGGSIGVVGLIETITNWAFVLLLVLAVFFIILAAYKYLFSGGSEEAVGTAHKMILYAAVAIAVAFLAKGIVFVVRQLVSPGSGSGTNVNIQYQTPNVNVNVGF